MNESEQVHVPSRRVLIVEDTEDIAESLRELLELDGHQVWLARDGEQAVREAAALAPDLVLCDIGLPGALDGYAVACALRQNTALDGTSLIAMSGFNAEADLKRARDAGFDAHLPKPPRLESLEKMLRELPRKGR